MLGYNTGIAANANVGIYENQKSRFNIFRGVHDRRNFGTFCAIYLRSGRGHGLRL